MTVKGDWGTHEKTTWTQFKKTALAQLGRKLVPFVSKLSLIQDMYKQQRRSLTLLEKLMAHVSGHVARYLSWSLTKSLAVTLFRVMKIIYFATCSKLVFK